MKEKLFHLTKPFTIIVRTFLYHRTKNQLKILPYYLSNTKIQPLKTLPHYLPKCQTVVIFVWVEVIQALTLRNGTWKGSNNLKQHKTWKWPCHVHNISLKLIQTYWSCLSYCKIGTFCRCNHFTSCVKFAYLSLSTWNNWSTACAQNDENIKPLWQKANRDKMVPKQQTHFNTTL